MPILAISLALVPAAPSGAAKSALNCQGNHKALMFLAVDSRTFSATMTQVQHYAQPLVYFAPDSDQMFAYILACENSVDSIRNVQPAPHSVQVLNADIRDPNGIRLPSDGFLPQLDAGSLWNVARSIDAPGYWDTGYIGQGIGVAVIDTGVSARNMFNTMVNDGHYTRVNRLIDGRDLSFDSGEAKGGDTALDGHDGFGHGTHIAGIIAGVSPDVQLPTGKPTNAAFHTFVQTAKTRFVGIAPGSHIVNVRVGANNGAVDVSQVIAGIDWVVAHRNDPGMNIRVLNLSYGTDGVQDHMHDPLQAAIDNAWKHNIFVVVSAGNEGKDATTLMNPAYDPNVMSVGAVDSKNTVYDNDDQIADFSSRGNAGRKVDIVAPGRSITSLAANNGVVDLAYPGGRVGYAYMKGSGTSQAAAVVSGAAALVLSHWPSLTPSQLKAVLMNSGGAIDGTGPKAPIVADRGVRRLDLSRIWSSVDRVSHGLVPTQQFVAGLGDGSIEASRGTFHVGYTDADGVDHVLQGDVDVTGAPWDGHVWRDLAFDGHVWRDEAFDGHVWRDGSWDGHVWRALGWSGGFWQDEAWQGHVWRGFGWS